MEAGMRSGIEDTVRRAMGDQDARINFLHEVASPQDTRSVLVEMVRQAKARD
jgi:hypothetical protein